MCAQIRWVTAVLAGLVLGGALPAQQPLDVTPLLEIAEFLPARVEPAKDAKTGFIVGGVNPTERIATLTEINGVAIADLEKAMRPKKTSSAGFLGPEEKLLDVLAADNRTVVDELMLSHQELARHLHALGAIGNWHQLQKKEGAEFLYHGQRFTVKVQHSKYAVASPFRDGTKSGSNVTVTNLATGKKLRYGLLVPYMVERYGFYEGEGTSYRLEPRAVVEVLGFLKKK